MPRLLSLLWVAAGVIPLPSVTVISPMAPDVNTFGNRCSTTGTATKLPRADGLPAWGSGPGAVRGRSGTGGLLRGFPRRDAVFGVLFNFLMTEGPGGGIAIGLSCGLEPRGRGTERNEARYGLETGRQRCRRGGERRGEKEGKGLERYPQGVPHSLPDASPVLKPNPIQGAAPWMGGMGILQSQPV